MITEILAASTGALGTYNAVRFFVTKGIERAREIKRQRETDAKIQKVVEVAESIYLKIKGNNVSDEDLVKAQAIANVVKSLVTKAKEAGEKAAASVE